MTSMRALESVSLRGLEAVTGFPDNSLRRQSARAAIYAHHPRVGGLYGPVGLPMADIREVDGGFRKQYSGGFIEVLDLVDGPKGYHDYEARVKLVGYRCHKQSEGGPDEPYFVVGVQGVDTASKVIKTFGPFEDVRSLSSHYLEEDVILTAQPPFVISVTAMDHDSGTPEDAAKQVEEGLTTAAPVVAAAIGIAFPPAAIGAGIVLALVELFRGPLSDAFSALAGMGDDTIGQSGAQMYDYDAEKNEWRNPKEQHVAGFDHAFNQEIVLDNGEGGRYSAYFQVQLFRVEAVEVPMEA
jgi:hypothetical protein